MAKISKNEHAMPLVGYRLLDNTEDAGIVGIALETPDGPFMFVANREILETLGAAFTHKAQTMPGKDPAA
jgi:hypothetical protein